MKSHVNAFYLVCSVLLLCLMSPGREAAAQAGAAASPNRSTTLQLAGLRERVTISRDARGIPYVEASNDDDLYFAQGYATASDRLWQMDLLRRTARGELSEIFGESVLEEDKRHRIYGFAALSEAMVAELPPQVRRAAEAYARGVNAFIASREGQNLAPEFMLLQYRPRPWRVADSMVIAKNLAEALSTTWQTDLMRAALAGLPPARRAVLLPETSPLDVLVVGSDRIEKARPAARQSSTRKPTDIEFGVNDLSCLASVWQAAQRSLARIGLDAEGGTASNNWVVSGQRTATRQAMLANDPHLSPSAPSIWYLTHLSAPGLRVAGATIPGAPGIMLGHNERIAWGATNLAPDVQDVYVEKFDKDNPRRYLTPEGWREAVVRREEIRVRKNPASPETEAVSFDVTVTRHGPVILERDGARYALRWTALDAKTVELVGLFLLNRATNWQEFTRALSQYTGPTQNFVYADTSGHIGYYGAGRIPIRRTGDGSLPYDGATDAGDWTGYIPFASLPHVYDPPSGIIVTANQRVVGRDYPFHLTHEWSQPYRARRVLNLLQAKPKLTTEDFRAIQRDTYSFGGAIFARAVVEATRGQSVPSSHEHIAANWRASLAELKEWDGHMNADSRAAALAAQMRAAFRRRLLADALGAEGAQFFNWGNLDASLDRIITERPAEWLPKEFSNYAGLLLACYADARQALTQRLGADEAKWTWGNWARVHFPHPLAAVPVVGQPFVVAPFGQNGSGYSAGTGPTVNVGASVSMRLIADTGDWDKTQHGIPLGQSGDPASPHWQDQLADWRAATPHVFPFSKPAVERASAAGSTLVLTPPAK